MRVERSVRLHSSTMEEARLLLATSLESEHAPVSEARPDDPYESVITALHLPSSIASLPRSSVSVPRHLGRRFWRLKDMRDKSLVGRTASEAVATCVVIRATMLETVEDVYRLRRVAFFRW